MSNGEPSKRQATGQEDVPGKLRRLWGLSVASGMGRPAELHVERVLRTAVEMADRHGLTGVTLSKIANALGYTTMSLYRHVGSKDELLFLMQDFGIGIPPEIAGAPGEWREGLRQWACAGRLLNQRHPWLARLPISGPPAGPNQIAWMEVALRLLRETGLDWGEKVGILTLISGYVRQATLLSQDLETGSDVTGRDKSETEQNYGRNLLQLVDPNKFPETAQLLASGIFEASPQQVPVDPTNDPDFTFGLERILDGVAAAIARIRPPQPGSGTSKAT